MCMAYYSGLVLSKKVGENQEEIQECKTGKKTDTEAGMPSTVKTRGSNFVRQKLTFSSPYSRYIKISDMQTHAFLGAQTVS